MKKENFGIPSFFYSILLLPLILFLGACNGQEGSSSSQTDDLYSAAVLLEKASAVDVSNHRADCPSAKKGKERVCVQICHVPPGNPDNSKSRILPLQSIAAHLSAGGPKHLEKSYLGPCGDNEQDDEPEDDGPNDDESPDMVEGPEELPDNMDDIPLFCQEMLELDPDCDGIDNNNGDDLYQPDNF